MTKVEDTETGGSNVSVPALPGCFTQGETVGECLDQASDANGTYLHDETAESLRAAGADLGVMGDQG